MIRYVFLSILLSPVLFMTGCSSLVQDVPDAKVPQEPQKPVTVGFISPQDSAVGVSIQLTKPVLGTLTANSIVSGAVVTISEGNRFMALPFVPGSEGVYLARTRNLRIEAGKTYKLFVTMPTGQTLSATAKVPEPIAIQEVVLDSVLARDFGSLPTYRYTVRFKWRDPAGEANYYRINADQLFSEKVTTGPNNQTQVITSAQRISFLNQDGRYVVSDVNQDGEPLTSATGYYNKYVISYSTNGATRAPGGPVTLYLLNTDKSYYDYHSALNRYSDADGNPFAEPVLLPGNIEGGGLGCFAAFNQSVVRFTPK